jgi:hypothetical protein
MSLNVQTPLMRPEPLIEARVPLPTLWLHDLTDSDQAKRLLNPPGDYIIKNGKRTLQHLREAAPGVAKNFIIKPTASIDTPFKLVSDIEPWHKPRFESFIAVSYCWHSDKWNVADSCKTSGSPNPDENLPLTVRMIGSLLKLRQSQNEGIWIDQFCIDQRNTVEKRNAIYHMDTIYRSARCVVIVFEDLQMSHESARLFCRLEESLSRLNMKRSPSEPSSKVVKVVGKKKLDEQDLSILVEIVSTFSDDVCKLVQGILRSRWSRRAWCYHEYLLSRDIMLLLPGPISPNFDIAIRPEIMNFLMKTTHNEATTVRWSLAPSRPEILIFDHKSSEDVHGHGAERTSSPFSLAIEICRRSCMSLDDKVNIALNVASIGLAFTGTVQDEDHARWILACVCLCYGDPSVLTVRQPRNTQLQSRSLISWLRWPDTYYNEPRLMSTAPTVTGDSTAFQLEFGMLKVDLLLLTQRLIEVSKPSVQKAQLLIERLQNVYPSLFHDLVSSQTQRPLRSDAANAVSSVIAWQQLKATRFLAAAIDNGLNWITRTFPRDDCLRGLQWPTDAISDCYCLLFPDQHTSANTGDSRTSLLCMIHAAFNQPSLWTHTMCLGPSNSKIILSVLGLHLDAGALLAIPTPLANASCAGLARLWVIVPTRFEEARAFEVVDKEYMFGSDSLLPNGNEVQLLRDIQIVASSRG